MNEGCTRAPDRVQLPPSKLQSPTNQGTTMKRLILATAITALSLGAAACADTAPRRVYVAAAAPPESWEQHVRWCFNHHPGYDPRSNTFVGRDGYPHECRG
jgi:hypothetical protein